MTECNCHKSYRCTDESVRSVDRYSCIIYHCTPVNDNQRCTVAGPRLACRKKTGTTGPTRRIQRPGRRKRAGGRGSARTTKTRYDPIPCPPYTRTTCPRGPGGRSSSLPVCCSSLACCWSASL